MRYIVETLLNRGDQKAVAWLLDMADRDLLRSVLMSGKLNKKSAFFWSLYLDVPRSEIRCLKKSYLEGLHPSWKN